MKRFAAITLSLSFAWSLAFGNAESLLICLHHDGSSHIIEQEPQVIQPTLDGCCAHSHKAEEPEHHDDGHDHEHDQPCRDLEIDATDWEDLQSLSYAKELKAPALFTSILESFAHTPSEQLLIYSFTPRPQGPPLPSESRRFAKIIQIRC